MNFNIIGQIDKFHKFVINLFVILTRGTLGGPPPPILISSSLAPPVPSVLLLCVTMELISSLARLENRHFQISQLICLFVMA